MGLWLVVALAAYAQTSAPSRMVREGQDVIAGSGGVTGNYLSSKDTSAPTQYVLPLANGCGSGFASATVAAGTHFQLLNKEGADYSGVAYGAITAGHIVTGGTTPGTVADTGATSVYDIPNYTCIVGVAQTSATVGNPVTVRYLGQGVFGAMVPHAIGGEFDSGSVSTALVPGATPVHVAPYDCTFVSWDANVSSGTATFSFWVVAQGTRIPNAGDSINTTGLQITSNTSLHSNTLTDFIPNPAMVHAGDRYIVALTAVTGSPYQASVQVNCK